MPGRSVAGVHSPTRSPTCLLTLKPAGHAGAFPAFLLSFLTGANKVVGSARYSLEHSADGRLLRLVFCVEAQYRLGVVENQLKLERTRPHYGGQRWWFLCPGCGGLARRLFLPPGESRFGCRRCRHLTYRSCQESHTTAGFFHRLQRLGLLPSLGKTITIVSRYRAGSGRQTSQSTLSSSLNRHRLDPQVLHGPGERPSTVKIRSSFGSGRGSTRRPMHRRGP